MSNAAAVRHDSLAMALRASGRHRGSPGFRPQPAGRLLLGLTGRRLPSPSRKELAEIEAAFPHEAEVGGR